MKSFYSIIILSIIFASCSTSNTVTSNHFLQKRKYTSGWHFNNQQREVSSKSESINETSNPESSISSKIKTAEPLNLENTNPIEQSECDTIILNNGQIVRVNIINTTDTLVHYTKCDSEDLTEFTIEKEKVKALQYANGDFEFIRKGPTASEIHQNGIQNDKNKKIYKANKERQPAIFVILAILFLVLGLLCLAAFVVIFAFGEAIAPLLIVACVLGALFLIFLSISVATALTNFT